MMIVLIAALLSVQNAYSWSYFRNAKNYGEYSAAQKYFRDIPRVPARSRGLEHKDDGRSKDWTFDQKRSRQAGRFQSEPLTNGIPYGKSGYAGSATLYEIEIAESGVSFLNVMTNGGQGDVDIYLKRDDYPTKRNYDIKSAFPGNQEQIILETPVPGRYFIVLYGYENYSMVGFEAEYR